MVDDFDDTRWLLRTWLERRGFRVIEAENGHEAVSEAQTGSPDLIIMDLEMPELDGLAATRQIRSLAKLAGVPIVAVSAYGAEQFRGPALQAGCNEYVSTPFDPAGARTPHSFVRALIKWHGRPAREPQRKSQFPEDVAGPCATAIPPD